MSDEELYLEAMRQRTKQYVELMRAHSAADAAMMKGEVQSYIAKALENVRAEFEQLSESDSTSSS